MTGRSDLYQDMILDHARSPRHYGRLEGPVVEHAGVNQLCGDEIALTLAVSGSGRLEAAFSSKGCALCRASASIMLEALAGGQMTPAAAAEQVASFRTGYKAAGGSGVAGSEAMAALYDLKPYATRARCVLLAWDTLAEALDGSGL